MRCAAGRTDAPVAPWVAARPAPHRDVFRLRRPVQRDRVGRVGDVDFFRRAQRVEQRNLNRPRERSAPVAAVADADRSRSSAAAEDRSSPCPAFRFSRPPPRALGVRRRRRPHRRHRADLPVLRRQRLAHARRPALLDQARLRGRRPLRRTSRSRLQLRRAQLFCTCPRSQRLPHLSHLRTVHLALCSLLFALPYRLGRFFDVDRRHERRRISRSRSGGQRSRVRIHLDPAQIGGAGAVCVDRGTVNWRTMSFSIRLRRPRLTGRGR